MNGVTFEKSDCPCLRCLYLIQARKINEEPCGNYDLHINCSISRCPKGYGRKTKKPLFDEYAEVRKKLFACVDTLKQCIEQKKKREGCT